VGTKHNHLNIEERDIIAIMLAQGKSKREIGRSLGRSHTAICREIENNAPPINKGYYLAHKAHERSIVRWTESHKRPRLKNVHIRDYVISKLKIGWSPEQIAGRISVENPSQHIGHEAIYQYIYREAPELIEYLARGHRKRYPKGHSRKHRRSHIPERVPLDERPAEVEGRNTIGHWEGDTMISRKSLAALQVLVERKSRFAKLTKLSRKTAGDMRNAAIRRLGILPVKARQTLTLDNGSENAEHLDITRALGIKTYFCAPFHSWEKGSVENLVGLVRRFFPKKTDFSTVSCHQIETVESLLNNRPRKCLNYATPIEVLSGAITGRM
jgi:IS30 family transposase